MSDHIADYVAPSLTVGSLFSGIGGFDLGLEAAGLRVLWQSEIEPYCNKVLAARWPHVPNHGDIRQIDWSTVERVAVLCGGFPCQDISRAGRRAGIGGVKSGLWSEVYRAVRSLRPDYLLLENSTSLTVQGLEVVASDLAEIGYDTEWDCLPAQAFGASHIRDRIYVLAYPSGGRHRTSDQTVFAGWTSSQLHGRWPAQPRMARITDGVPHRVDRVRSLGNAVCPPVAEWLGERLLAAHIDGGVSA